MCVLRYIIMNEIVYWWINTCFTSLVPLNELHYYCRFLMNPIKLHVLFLLLLAMSHVLYHKDFDGHLWGVMSDAQTIFLRLQMLEAVDRGFAKHVWDHETSNHFTEPRFEFSDTEEPDSGCDFGWPPALLCRIWTRMLIIVSHAGKRHKKRFGEVIFLLAATIRSWKAK